MSTDYKRKTRSTLASCVYNLEETNSRLQDKVEKLQDQLAKLVEIVGELKVQLKVEKLKAHLFAQLLKMHTSLKVEELVEEKEGELHVYNYPEGKVPLIIHDYLGGKRKTRQYVMSPPKVEKVKTPLLGPVASPTKMLEEDEYFMEIETTRNYTKGLKSLQLVRKSRMVTSDLQTYTGFVEIHKKRLLEIFKKKYEDKKVESLLTKAFTPLEQRLLRLGKYYNTVLEPDEIELCKQAIHKGVSTELSVFVPTEFSEKFYHYGLAMFPLEELLALYLQTRNLIYLPLEKNEANDPFSFYVLNKVEPRKWKLEIRLDELSKMFGQALLNYGVDLFRKIYADMFHDNIFRADYATSSQWAQQDGEQLLLNLLLLSQPKKWCKTVQQVVQKVATYEPLSDDERFNFKVDERLSKTQFNKEVDSINMVVEMLQHLFEEISTEDAQELAHKKGIML